MRKVFVALAALLGATLLPAAPAQAQTPPHVFVGEATLDGVLAPDGTAITALVEGVPAPRSQTEVKDGKYTLFVEAPETPIIGFAVGDFVAEQSFEWVTGGASVLDLSATSQLPSIRLTADPAPPETVSPADQFLVKVKANTGFNKAVGGEIFLSYDPDIFRVERDRTSLHQGPSRQTGAGGSYRSQWEYLNPASTVGFSGELEGIFITVLDDAPAGPTKLTIQASLVSESGQLYELEPEALTFQINVVGLAADFNEDRSVDIFDLAALGSVWGIQAGQAGFDGRFDIDNDGLIGIGDLVALLQSYGTGK